MNKKLGLALAALVCLALAAPSPVRAEVSAEVDETGEYLRTLIRGNASVKNLRVWSVAKGREQYHPLNVHGDENGDLWPAILENPFDLNHPWVVWSRFDGTDYDLAWSRWTGSGWLDIAWLSPGNPAGNDLDPSLAYSPTDGRPHVGWWREQDGSGRVYLSLFLNTVWMAPYLVSDPAIDSRYPVIQVLDDGKIEVTYETALGTVTRVVVFHSPTTITDDINPLDHFTKSDKAEESGGSDSVGY